MFEQQWNISLKNVIFSHNYFTLASFQTCNFHSSIENKRRLSVFNLYNGSKRWSIKRYVSNMLQNNNFCVSQKKQSDFPCFGWNIPFTWGICDFMYWFRLGFVCMWALQM